MHPHGDELRSAGEPPSGLRAVHVARSPDHVPHVRNMQSAFAWGKPSLDQRIMRVGLERGAAGVVVALVEGVWRIGTGTRVMYGCCSIFGTCGVESALSPRSLLFVLCRVFLLFVWYHVICCAAVMSWYTPYLCCAANSGLGDRVTPGGGGSVAGDRVDQ